MEVIEKFNIPYRTNQKFKIVPIGDIHAGAVQCDEDFIKNFITQIANEKDTYVIGMGDYADCITQSDPRWDISGLAKWVERDNIMESQRQFLADLWKPIAKKTICMLTGNHEENIHLRMQTDFTRNLCKDLNIKYAGYSAFIPLIFDRQSSKESHQYIIHAWHGAGAARTEGARINRLMYLVNEIEADIYCMGHLHAKTVYSADRLTYRNNKIKSTPIVALMTGSSLKSYEQGAPTSYAERAGYKPSVIGFSSVIIDPTNNKITVEV